MQKKLKPKALVFLIPFLFTLTAYTGVASSQEPPAAVEDNTVIRPGDTLDLKTCINIALKKQPNIKAAANNVYAGQSRVFQAESNYYPQVEASAGYSRTASAPSVNRPTVSSSRAFDLYSSSIDLTQKIYDFGRTSGQVNVQRSNLESTRADLENTRNQTAFNVKQAYYTVLQAEKNRTVAQDSVKQFEQHLEQAKGFYEVGTKPRIDVTKAEVDLSNAKVNLIKAENALRIARVNLNNAMGVPEAPEFALKDELVFERYGITMDEALAKALANRPDLKSTFEKAKAAEESLALSKKNYYPTLSGNAAYNWSGESLPLERGWNVGATVTIPIFTGFLTKYQVEESKANLNVSYANLELSRQNVFLDVRQAYLNLREAEERVPATELAVRQAAENLELADARYATGVGNPIELTDAAVAYSNARLAYFQALSDYKIAQANLDKAIGSM